MEFPRPIDPRVFEKALRKIARDQPLNTDLRLIVGHIEDLNEQRDKALAKAEQARSYNYTCIKENDKLNATIAAQLDYIHDLEKELAHAYALWQIEEREESDE